MGLGTFGPSRRGSNEGDQCQMQEKVQRRDISEVDLVNQAWSTSAPKEGAPRLRVGDPGDPQTYTSLNEGALALKQALYKLWRNPLAHLPDKMARQRALEGLAAVSAFAYSWKMRRSRSTRAVRQTCFRSMSLVCLRSVRPWM